MPTDPKKCEHLVPHMKPCTIHGSRPWLCPDILFCTTSDGGYGMPIHDGGGSFVAITHCPFCGAELPTSLEPKK
jgi:hypothetical protein